MCVLHGRNHSSFNKQLYFTVSQTGQKRVRSCVKSHQNLFNGYNLHSICGNFKWHSGIPWVIPTSPNKEHIGEDWLHPFNGTIPIFGQQMSYLSCWAAVLWSSRIYTPLNRVRSPRHCWHRCGICRTSAPSNASLYAMC